MILARDAGAVRTLSLSNPGKKNALDAATLLALQAALPTAPSSPSQPIRCVVLRGDPAGGAFCAGYDLTAVHDAIDPDTGLDPIGPAAAALAACPVPVIAAVDGACYGGGVELLCACSLRIGDARARIAVPAARLGLVYPAAGLARFVAALGPFGARRLFLSPEPFDGAGALSLGLLDVLVDDAGSTADAWAQHIATLAPLAVSGVLSACRGDDATAAALRAGALASGDLQEGLAAAAAKRTPTFSGA